MDTQVVTGTVAEAPPQVRFRPGDFVLRRGDSVPVLCEVVGEEESGRLLRVRGVGWAPGFSMLVDPAELKPMKALLR
jgi:hypothetical protein